MAVQRVGIIDYGMGNLTSVRNAFMALDCDARIMRSAADVAEITHLVLPGVGAFPDGMRQLHQRDWIPAMTSAVLEQGMPFLGICLGQQLLATRGSEHGWHDGLGWIDGEVIRFEDSSLRIPHIGWNDVTPEHHRGNYSEGFDKDGVFYFVHSFHLVPSDPAVVDGRCDYGIPFAASVWKDNIRAVQFHPEKSQAVGLQVLKNFLADSE